MSFNVFFKIVTQTASDFADTPQFQEALRNKVLGSDPQIVSSIQQLEATYTKTLRLKSVFYNVHREVARRVDKRGHEYVGTPYSNGILGLRESVADLFYAMRAAYHDQQVALKKLVRDSDALSGMCDSYGLFKSLGRGALKR